MNTAQPPPLPVTGVLAGFFIVWVTHRRGLGWQAARAFSGPTAAMC